MPFVSDAVDQHRRFSLFPCNDGVNGSELWRSNGTENGTELVANIAAGSVNSNPTGFVRSGLFVYFAAFDELHGTEVYFQNLIPSSIGNDSLTIRYSPGEPQEKVIVQRNTTRGVIPLGHFPRMKPYSCKVDWERPLTFVGTDENDIFRADDGYVVMNQFAVRHRSSSSWETIVFSGEQGDELYRLTPEKGTDSTIRIVESGIGLDWLDFQMSAEPIVVNLGITSVQTTADGALKYS